MKAATEDERGEPTTRGQVSIKEKAPRAAGDASRRHLERGKAAASTRTMAVGGCRGDLQSRLMIDL